MTVLETKDLTKVIGKFTICDKVSLRVEEGQILGFLGPNGAGKTTTIKMITGLMKITDGSVKICGEDLRENFESCLSKIGAVVEEPRMYPYMTGYDNMVINAKLYGNIPKTKIDELITRLGMNGYIKRKVKTYSLGMKQRLGLAIALINSPKLLILDEPSNGLDPAGIKELRMFLKYLAENEKIAVLVSSHILSEMEQMCDHVCIIDKGKIIVSKSIEEFTGEGAQSLEEAFLAITAPQIVGGMSANV